ncbi:MAG: SCO family protein [Acidobacteriota bacterium]|jgi:protein SCO1/2|nr:MAG: SCO family protein [Acidobacteriota bacterium]
MNTTSIRRFVRGGAAGLALAAAGVVSVAAQPSRPMSVPSQGSPATEQIPMLREVGVDQSKLDSQVPLDAMFVDHAGRDVRLGDYFGHGRPVALVLAYYECPALCGQVISATAASMIPLEFDAGREFDVLVVSFDPGETPQMAAERRDAFLTRYGRERGAEGVHFLTGRQESIEALTDAVGFRYRYDAQIDQYAHPSVLTILTPEGRVSRYLFGIEFAPRDLRFALIDASSGGIGTVVDQAILFCYLYDPATGRYGFAVINALRIAGILTIAALGTFIVLSLRRERRANAAKSAATGVR